MARAYSPSLQAPLFRCGPCTVAVSSTRLALGNLKGPGPVHSGEQQVTGPTSPGPTASRIPAQGVKCPVAHGLWVTTSLCLTQASMPTAPALLGSCSPGSGDRRLQSTRCPPRQALVLCPGLGPCSGSPSSAQRGRCPAWPGPSRPRLCPGRWCSLWGTGPSGLWGQQDVLETDMHSSSFVAGECSS